MDVALIVVNMADKPSWKTSFVYIKMMHPQIKALTTGPPILSMNMPKKRVWNP